MEDELNLKRGQAIPGSRYMRDFCCACGEPMRVSHLSRYAFCLQCDPSHSLTRNKNAGRPEETDARFHGKYGTMD